MKIPALLVALAATLAGCSGRPAQDADTAPRPHADGVAVPASVAVAPAGTGTGTGTGAGTTPAEAAPTAALARFDGYGDMRFGMDEAAFRRAWQGELAGSVDAAGGCSSLRPVWVKQPRDFGFLFEHGHFARYDVGTARETAPGGGRVGMDVTRLKALYGEALSASPHKYVAGAQYLRIAGPGGDTALVFETDAGGKVVRWRVGVPPQIDYVEGCG